MSTRAKFRRSAAMIWCPRVGCDEGPWDHATGLQEHLYDAHGAPRPVVSWGCRDLECGARFASQDDRDSHEVEVHGGPVEWKRKGKRSNPLGKGKSSGTFVCGIGGCTATFSHIVLRANHRKAEHPGWVHSDVDLSVLLPSEADGVRAGRAEAAASAELAAAARAERREIVDREYVCGVFVDGRACPEISRSPQARGAHRRHAHPGWSAGGITAGQAAEALSAVASAGTTVADPQTKGRACTIWLEPDEVDVLDALAFLRDLKPIEMLRKIVARQLAEALSESAVRTAVEARQHREQTS